MEAAAGPHVNKNSKKLLNYLALFLPANNPGVCRRYKDFPSGFRPTHAEIYIGLCRPFWYSTCTRQIFLWPA